jgi:tetratricopeptide (TPR) repeat protein
LVIGALFNAVVTGGIRDNRRTTADFDRAIQLNPNDARAYNDRGMARSKLGDNRGAIADYNEAVRINPNYDKAYYNRGNAHSELGDWQGAIVD